MPKFLEDKLKAEYPGNPGAVYGTMNRLGFMHGNKATPLGMAAQLKHERDQGLRTLVRSRVNKMAGR